MTVHAEQENATQEEAWDQYMLDIPAEVAIKVPVVPNRPLPTAVRATGFSSMLVYISRKTGGILTPEYGRVLHDQSIYGVKAEGKVKITTTTQKLRRFRMAKSTN